MADSNRQIDDGFIGGEGRIGEENRKGEFSPDREAEVAGILRAMDLGEVEPRTYATELVGHRHSVAELHAERERVSAECARLRKALEHWRHEVGKKQSQIDQLRERVAELERFHEAWLQESTLTDIANDRVAELEAERDAAQQHATSWALESKRQAAQIRELEGKT